MCADFWRCSESGLGAAPSPPSVSAERQPRAPPGHTKARPHPSRPRGRRGDPFPGVRGALLLPSDSPGSLRLLPPAEAHDSRPVQVKTPWVVLVRETLAPGARARPHPSQLGRRPDSGWPGGGALGEQARGSQPALQSPAPRPARPSPELGARPRGCSPGDRFLRSVLNYPSSPQSCFALKSGKGLRMGDGGDLALRSAPPPRGFCCRRASANSSPSSVLLLLFQIIIA